MKWVVGFDSVSELVAGSEILGKLGHVEEPVIIPMRVQWKVAENGVGVVEETEAKVGSYMVLNSIPGPGFKM